LEAYRKKHPNQPRKFHIEEQNQIINKEKDE